MVDAERLEQFSATARKVGAEVTAVAGVDQAVAAIRALAKGPVLLPGFASAARLGLAQRLRDAGCEVREQNLRASAAQADTGVTGANFAIADTGSVVLESTPEEIRLATTLPERHVVLLDPRKIVADGLEAVPVLRRFHQRDPRNYLAYITGPSRTADIERVLTIGVHGPRQLHILLLEGLSADPLEM